MKTGMTVHTMLRFCGGVFLLALSLLALSTCGQKESSSTTIPVTTANPKGGVYTETQYVILASDEAATVYYSLDGADPVPGAPNTISGPSPLFWIRAGAGTTVLKFFAVDGEGNREPVETETYVVTIPQLPPLVANAGPDRVVITGSLVTVGGSGSSAANGAYLTYRWSLTAQPVGSTATLSSPTAANPAFTPDLDGTYVLSLVVNDGNTDSAPDTVIVSAHQYLFPDTDQTTSYTTTFGEDSDYTGNPPWYTNNGDKTITDNNTGLLWQQYSSGTLLTWDEANAYCAGLSLVGASWRLPSRMELLTITVYDRSPAINTSYFANGGTKSWTCTPDAYDGTYAWGVDFYDGNAETDYKTWKMHAQCVSGGQRQSIFINGTTVTVDTNTNLMWQYQDDGSIKTWEQALAYCEGLSLGGYTDWRLPNIRELSSIVDDTRSIPAINAAYFSCNQGGYWSSTSRVNSSAYAWLVDFFDGRVVSSYKTDAHAVRCVR